MVEVRKTAAFAAWFGALRDARVQARIDIRILLGGGDKRSQTADIKAAKALAAQL